MFQELDLTKEQQREMRKLMGEQMKQRQAITQRYLDKLPEAERQAMQKDLDASREKTHQSMRALLKPEQQKAFDEGLKKMEEKRAERAEFSSGRPSAIRRTDPAVHLIPARQRPPSCDGRSVPLLPWRDPVRSLFWRILATFWLAIALVAGLAMLLGHALNQDAWILGRHPALQGLAETWTEVYERQARWPLSGCSNSTAIVHGSMYRSWRKTASRSSAAPSRARSRLRGAPSGSRAPIAWRRLTADYTSPTTGETYLFIYRIPHPELQAWHRGSLAWPLSALGIALVVLTGFSLLLTLSITRPLDRLRRAVHDLGQTTYQQQSLARLATRRDELGVLASDFNRMGARLQALIGSQRRLLRDVSHELRSPLARLRIALGLAERATPTEREVIWPRLARNATAWRR